MKLKLGLEHNQTGVADIMCIFNNLLECNRMYAFAA